MHLGRLGEGVTRELLATGALRLPQRLEPCPVTSKEVTGWHQGMGILMWKADTAKEAPRNQESYRMRGWTGQVVFQLPGYYSSLPRTPSWTPLCLPVIGGFAKCFIILTMKYVSL